MAIKAKTVLASFARPETRIRLMGLGRGGFRPRRTCLGQGVAKIMFYVYILSSEKCKRLYKGLTSDLQRRVREHNSGHVSSTKGYQPWTLVYYEAFTNKKDAEIEERFLKSGKGRQRLQFLLQNTVQRRGG